MLIYAPLHFVSWVHSVSLDWESWKWEVYYAHGGKGSGNEVKTAGPSAHHQPFSVSLLHTHLYPPLSKETAVIGQLWSDSWYLGLMWHWLTSGLAPSVPLPVCTQQNEHAYLTGRTKQNGRTEYPKKKASEFWKHIHCTLKQIKHTTLSTVLVWHQELHSKQI